MCHHYPFLDIFCCVLCQNWKVFFFLSGSRSHFQYFPNRGSMVPVHSLSHMRCRKSWRSLCYCMCMVPYGDSHSYARHQEMRHAFSRYVILLFLIFTSKTVQNRVENVKKNPGMTWVTQLAHSHDTIPYHRIRKLPYRYGKGYGTRGTMVEVYQTFAHSHVTRIEAAHHLIPILSIFSLLLEDWSLVLVWTLEICLTYRVITSIRVMYASNRSLLTITIRGKST